MQTRRCRVTIAGVESLPTPLSSAGRLGRRPFVVAIVLVYLAGFATQFLLAAPVIAAASVLPFLAAQVVVAWFWYALHVRRLRDSGRSSGSAAALTILYILAMLLLLLVMLAADAPGQSSGADGSAFAVLFRIFVILYLLGMVLGQPDLGVFGVILIIVLSLVMLPMIIAFVFTVVTAARPSVADAS